MPVQHSPNNNQQLKPTEELNVRYFGDKAAAAAEAFKEAPISLAAEGRYLVSFEGRDLHVLEVTKGISTYDVTNHRQVGAPVFERGNICIPLLVNGAIGRIVLHTAATADVKDAVPENVIPALPLIREFKGLSDRANNAMNPLTPEDKLRMAELVREIQSACKKPSSPAKSKALKANDNSADADEAEAEETKRPSRPRQSTPRSSSPPSSSGSSSSSSYQRSSGGH